MTAPTSTQATVYRYSGDTEPVIFNDVTNVDVDDNGLLAIDYDDTDTHTSQAVFANGMWASIDTTAIPKPTPERDKHKPRRGSIA